MRHDTRRRGAALAAATGLAFTAAIAGAPSATATDGQFEIWNLSSADITLAEYWKDPDPNHKSHIPATPSVGTVVKPGHSFRIDVPRGGGYETPAVHTVAKLAGRDASGSGQAQRWKVDMGANTFLTIACSVEGNPPPARQTAACGNYIGKDNNVATVADGPEGTTVVIPASDTARQAEINSSFCQNPYKQALSITCTDAPDALRVYAGWTTWVLQHR